MDKRVSALCLCLAFLLWAITPSPAGMKSGSYIIPNPVFSGGGAPSSSAGFAAGSTLGQSSPLMLQATAPASSSFELYPGFWYALAGGGAVTDTDGDGFADPFDNCPATSNPDQIDTYPPPAGNSCGDACECEGNFDGDADQDGSDAFTFKQDFGRNPLRNPCGSSNPCNGNFDCDGDVDGSDAFIFKQDFGRSPLRNPCPFCPTSPWCAD